MMHPKCDPWQRDHNLMVDMCSLSKSPNLALKFSRNASKSLNRGDWHSNKGANKTRAMLDNIVLKSTTQVELITYWWRWNWMTRCIWLTKIQNFDHEPSNLLGKLIRNSFSWGWVMEMHPKNVKTWLFGNEEQIHKVFDFLIVHYEGQQRFFHGHRNFFLGCKHDFKKNDNKNKNNENRANGSLFKL